MQQSKGNEPVCKTMCPTCPFRQGSPYAYLAETLAKCATTTASRICHSTGSNAINKSTGKPPHVCRGSRDIQLQVMAAMGVIDEATDAAWNVARVAIGMDPVITEEA